MNDRIAIIYAPKDITEYLTAPPEKVQARLQLDGVDLSGPSWDGFDVNHFLIHHRFSTDARGAFFSTYVRLPCGKAVGGKPSLKDEAYKILIETVHKYTTNGTIFCPFQAKQGILPPYLAITDSDRVPMVEYAFRESDIQIKTIGE